MLEANENCASWIKCCESACTLQLTVCPRSACVNYLRRHMKVCAGITAVASQQQQQGRRPRVRNKKNTNKNLVVHAEESTKEVEEMIFFSDQEESSDSWPDSTDISDSE